MMKELSTKSSQLFTVHYYEYVTVAIKHERVESYQIFCQLNTITLPKTLQTSHCWGIAGCHDSSLILREH